MASRLGEDGNRQALAHFITSSPWDPAYVRARLAWRMHEAIGPEALIIDDTGFLKDGDASAGVSRQYTGTAGKVTNCQVGVSLHLARDHASAAVNWRLFLPASWDPASAVADADKVARRTRCGFPAQVGHVEKRQLALDMIDETRSWGIDVPLVVADAGYGDAAAFRLGLEERDLPHAVGVSGRHTAHPADARPVQSACAGTGRPPKVQYPEPAQTMKDLVVAAGRRPHGRCPGGKDHAGARAAVASSACTRASSPSGSARPDAASARLPMIRSCPSDGCWPSGRPARASPCSSGCRICPPGCPWRLWCGWPTSAGASSTTTAR
nr:transposase [Streptomyces caniscabiei]